jgi:FkbM family methyltransferase
MMRAVSSLFSKTLGSIKRVMPSKLKSAIASKVMEAVGKPEYPVELSSYAQAGEDAVLRFLFKDYPVALHDVTYLDIGARHPVFSSNTFLFYCAGARGVCVDADATFIAMQRAMRPRDKVLHIAVSDSDAAEGTFYFMDGGGSTLDKAEAEHRASLGTAAIKDVLNVPFVHVNKLIEQNFENYPTLLSIDIENMDLPVLRALDYARFPIPVICVETCRYSETHLRPKDPSIAAFLVTKGYEAYADTYVNTIFVNRAWFYRS